MPDAEAIRAALRCDRPGCSCQRGKQTHCPAHDDAHPSFDVAEKDGKTLWICRAGCSQEETTEALRAKGLLRPGPPPVPKVLPAFFAVCRFLERHVVLPCEEAVTAVALWVLVAWVLEAFDVAPYLSILSPTMRAGKTKLLETLELLTPRPWMVLSPSAAVLFRKVAADAPTLLLDEAETIWSSKSGEAAEALRALLNGGHRRGAVVPRCVGDGAKVKVVEFSVFCAKAVAAIGTVPQTILDRSVVVHLKRATAAEVGRVRGRRHRDAVAEAAPIREALAAWADAVLPRLREAAPPAVPAELDGRAQDLWEPLLAVAAECSDAVYALGWKAALVLSGASAREEDSTGLRLLRDIQQVRAARGGDRITSGDLIEALCEDDSAPWGDWHGKRISPHTLARLLRNFGIEPRKIRTGEQTARGYYWTDCEDTFTRYGPPSPLEPGFKVEQVEQLNQDAAFSHFPRVEHEESVPLAENGANPHGDWIVPLVPLANPPGGDGEAEMVAPEDLAKGGGLSQALLRVGEGFAWAQRPYAPGRAIAAGQRAWLTFIRANVVEELQRAWQGLAQHVGA